MPKPSIDLVVRGGEIVTPGRTRVGDLLIAKGKFAGMVAAGKGEGDSVLDAEGLLVFPGFIDAHVHLNEPGRADWEGLETGTRALAAGGVTTFFDMPLNSTPPVITAVELEKKRTVARKKSRVDFALWGGLVAGNVGELPGMAEAGAVGFKSFLCNSGMDDFPATDERTLLEGAKMCAKLDRVLAVHAEDDALAARLTAEQVAGGKTGWRDYLRSRPVAVEVAGVRMALEAAERTGCALHIVHNSCPEALELIRQARRAKVNVTAETCPHYLLLTELALGKQGATAKCAPPLRPRRAVEHMWEALAAGQIQTIGSDHSPSPPDLKRGSNFFKIWGGIGGCQHAFPLLIGEALRRGIPPGKLVGLTSENTAKRFRLRGKGTLDPGADADLALIRLGLGEAIKASKLLYRHQLSAYVRMRPRAEVTYTILRGEVLTLDAPPQGREVGLLQED